MPAAARCGPQDPADAVAAVPTLATASSCVRRCGSLECHDDDSVGIDGDGPVRQPDGRRGIAGGGLIDRECPTASPGQSEGERAIPLVDEQDPASAVPPNERLAVYVRLLRRKLDARVHQCVARTEG